MSAPSVVIAILVAVILLLALALWWALGQAGRASRSRVRRALHGEDRAAALLVEAGWSIEARQERAVWWMRVDGVDVEVEVRADYVVGRDGRRGVAEVKTGDLAPDPLHPATRRQLLEYALAFALDEVLLVDAGTGRIRRVSFPVLETR